MPIRFHLDEHVQHAIAEGLRRRGIDVTTTLDAGLAGASDEQHLAYARADGRVVFTHDPDFLRLHDRGVQHAGIAFCHVQSRTIGQLVRALAGLWLRRTPEEMWDRVEFL